MSAKTLKMARAEKAKGGAEPGVGRRGKKNAGPVGSRIPPPTYGSLGIGKKQAARARVYTESMLTHPENFLVRLPKGTLSTWRRAAKREGVTVAELIRRAVADRIESGTRKRRP